MYVRRTLRVLCVIVLLGAVGVAHADIAEQRRRLPPPPEVGCTDPIAGDWQSQFWTRGYWLTRTLRLGAADPASRSVVGVELIETWPGPRDVAARPTCDPAAPIGWYAGESPLVGTFDGSRLDVRATRFELGRIVCGMGAQYVPDHFRGSLESGGTELFLQNNDGRNPETTVVFRRVTCTNGSAAAPVALPVPSTTPPAPPPRATRGCSSYVPGL